MDVAIDVGVCGPWMWVDAAVDVGVAMDVGGCGHGCECGRGCGH